MHSNCDLHNLFSLGSLSWPETLPGSRVSTGVEAAGQGHGAGDAPWDRRPGALAKCPVSVPVISLHVNQVRLANQEPFRSFLSFWSSCMLQPLPTLPPPITDKDFVPSAYKWVGWMPSERLCSFAHEVVNSWQQRGLSLGPSVWAVPRPPCRFGFQWPLQQIIILTSDVWSRWRGRWHVSGEVADTAFGWESSGWNRAFKKAYTLTCNPQTFLWV